MTPHRFLLGVALVSVASWLRAADRLELTWPTPNTAWSEGKSIGAFIQDAGSGEPESGAFGGVRNGGVHFHEGIDIKAVSRDRRREPTDDVFAALEGVVRHIASTPDGSYGRYIVLEHPGVTPAVYTLYAHLAKIAPNIREGVKVTRGEVIATMGHSSGGYSIPVDRAHLHFEIGVVATMNFQRWYDHQGFGSKNEHGVWNGYNLLGVDPLDFFNAWRSHRIDTVQDYFSRLTPTVRVRIATRQTPDFITRYPSLLTKALPMGPISGWEIAFNWTGLPFAWTPLSSLETLGLPSDQPRIVDANAEIIRRQRSKVLAVSKRGNWVIGRDLDSVLKQLFVLK